MAQPSGCRIETRLDAWRSEARRTSKVLLRAGKSVEMSLDAADTSVRATESTPIGARPTSLHREQMRTTTLIRQSLTYYWRTNLAVVLGVAIAVSVLAGAALVGESVRASLTRYVSQPARRDRFGHRRLRIFSRSAGRFFPGVLSTDRDGRTSDWRSRPRISCFGLRRGCALLEIPRT